VKKERTAKSKSDKVKPKVPAMSIFNKPRLPTSGPMQAHKSQMVAYDGIGGTMKVLQSDLKGSLPENSQKPVSGANTKRLSLNAPKRP